MFDNVFWYARHVQFSLPWYSTLAFILLLIVSEVCVPARYTFARYKIRWPCDLDLWPFKFSISSYFVRRQFQLSSSVHQLWCISCLSFNMPGDLDTWLSTLHVTLRCGLWTTFVSTLNLPCGSFSWRHTPTATATLNVFTSKLARKLYKYTRDRHIDKQTGGQRGANAMRK